MVLRARVTLLFTGSGRRPPTIVSRAWTALSDAVILVRGAALAGVEDLARGAALPGRAIVTVYGALFSLMILTGCAPPRHLAEQARWLVVYNRWNRTLDQLNAEATSGAAETPRSYRLLRDSTRTAMDSLNLVSADLDRARAPLLYTFLQRIRYNLLATELGRLDSRLAQLKTLAGRVDSLTESGEFASAERFRHALDRGADSLGLVAKALLDEDLRSAWDTLQAPLPHLSSRGGGLGPRLRVAGDSIPPDPGDVRARLQRLCESTRRLPPEIAVRRPAQVRSGWTRRANALVEELNAAVRVDSAGDHRNALSRLASVRDSAVSTLAAMAADTTLWPGRPAPGGVPPTSHRSSAPGDPEGAVREVLRLVDLNREAICHGLAVDLYHDVSQRLALGTLRPRADAARLDSVLADPRLDVDLRRKIVGLRKDLHTEPSPEAPVRR
jgi:hypothetical protein